MIRGRHLTEAFPPGAGNNLMPIHDWARLDAGIFHHFHQRWIGAITDVLNQRLLPDEFYALAEQQGAGFEPDVLTLKANNPSEGDGDPVEPNVARPSGELAGNGGVGRGLLVVEPSVSVTAETDLEFYRRKQNVAAIRHVSEDRLVAVVELVSKGNKSGRKSLEDLVRKAAEFLSRRIHLLILDLQPATTRDPQGTHGAIWDEFAGQEYCRPKNKPLTLVAYESASRIRAFIEPVGVGDTLTEMPLFLNPGQYVKVPLEETYRIAYDSVPKRFRMFLERA
jgi:hypothetical protein